MTWRTWKWLENLILMQLYMFGQCSRSKHKSLIITWILFGIKHLSWLLKTRRRNHLFLRFKSLILLILLLLLFYFAFFIIQHLRSFLWSSGSIFCFADIMRWIHALYARNMHWISFLDFENLYCDVCFLFCLEGREIKPHNCLRCENIYHCTVIACTSDYVVFSIALCQMHGVSIFCSLSMQACISHLLVLYDFCDAIPPSARRYLCSTSSWSCQCL